MTPLRTTAPGSFGLVPPFIGAGWHEPASHHCSFSPGLVHDQKFVDTTTQVQPSASRSYLLLAVPNPPLFAAASAGELAAIVTSSAAAARIERIELLVEVVIWCLHCGGMEQWSHGAAAELSRS